MTVDALKPSAGQSLETPSQLSATSQPPAAARQTAVLFASSGQRPLVPVQNSAASQAPAAGRHSSVAGWKASVGQVALVPVQSSATSHAPVAPRHSNVAGLKLSAGQVPLVPVQNSATSHGPAAGRHVVVDGSNWQVEEQQSPSTRFPSSHCSPASTTPSPQHAPRIAASTMLLMESGSVAWSLMLPSVPPSWAITSEYRSKSVGSASLSPQGEGLAGVGRSGQRRPCTWDGCVPGVSRS